MNIKPVYLFIFSIFSFISCTKKITIDEPPREIITNVIQNVDGDLENYIYAKNERITMTFKKEEIGFSESLKVEIPIKLVFSTSYSIPAGTGYNQYGPFLELEFLDKTDRKIGNYIARMDIRNTDLASFIKSSNREEWVTFTISELLTSNLQNTNSFIEDLSRTSKIRIKSEIIEEKNRTSSIEDDINDDSSFSSNNSINTGNSDCDKFLDQYEEVVLEYVRIAKSISNNPEDMSYMTKMAQLAEKAGKIEGNLENCKNNAKVAAKFAELNAKMIQAMY